jgi:hypothetical protein
MDLYLRCTIGVERDLPLVPHFVAHYKSLGVDKFLFVLHAYEKSSPNLIKARSLLLEYGIDTASTWITRSWDTGTNAEKHWQIIKNLSDTSWIISTDIDEFHNYPIPLPAFVEDLSAAGFDVVKGRLVQRVTRTFHLAPLNQGVNIFEQFPREADFGIGNSSKVMLHRKRVLTTPGHHDFCNDVNSPVRLYPRLLKVAHCKWFKGVELKYVDPLLMAHHSETWEFAAYDQFIQKNFFGWKRWANTVRYHPALASAVRVVFSTKRIAGSLYRKLPRAVPARIRT